VFLNNTVSLSMRTTVLGRKKVKRGGRKGGKGNRERGGELVRITSKY